MLGRISRVLAIVACAALAIPAIGAASGALKGRTYTGTTSSEGKETEGNPRTVASVGISLRVSHDGKSVTVRFLSSRPIIYCGSKLTIYSQVTKAVRISSSGTFRVRVGEKFSAGTGETALSQVVSGRFSGHSVKGTIRTEPPECGGTTAFSAHAH
jgi:hypothetical protein